MLFARSAAALALLVVLGGGGCAAPNDGCAPLPPPPTQALVWLSCGATDLTDVSVSGPCATGDAGPSNEAVAQGVNVSSPSPGVCHVELTFATGFTYATDVTFQSMTRVNCGTTEAYIGPTQGVFDVNNPSTTCVDAGLDAPADAPTEAPSDAAVDVQADAGAGG
jgi:hypothetical protein